MGRAISLFSGYGVKENRTTNYCLLILKMVYEESPRLLAQALDSMLGTELGDLVGVQFKQQESRGTSVPDGLIVQRPFTVYIETKNWDWFYDDQLERHLSALAVEQGGMKVLIALSNFEREDMQRFERITRLIERDHATDMVFRTVAFDGFVAALEQLTLPPDLADMVREFRSYLDSEGRLSTWRTLLDVVNCVNTMHEIEGGCYLCPPARGAYKHLRAKFFGPYKGKTVDRICLIEGVVEFDEARMPTVAWRNVDLAPTDLVARAADLLERFRPGRYPHQVFVLGQAYPTSFRKDTERGMQGSKRYFYVPDIGPDELAGYLRDKDWTSML